MKKFLSLLLALCLLCGMTAAVAEDTETKITNETESKEATTTINYSVALNENYTVTIPTSVTFPDPDENGVLKATMELSIVPDAGYNKLNGEISIKLKSSANGFAMKRDGGEDTIQYSMYKTLNDAGAYADPITAGGDTPLLTWQQGGEAASASLTLYMKADMQEVKIAGDYSDTLTFTVSTGETKVDVNTDPSWEGENNVDF